MYDFPLIETSHRCSKLTISEMIKEQFGLFDNFAVTFRSAEYRHILSHRILYARFYIIQFYNSNSNLERVIQNNSNYRIINVEEIKRFPIPRLLDKFLSENRDILQD
ncbi:MAG: hypothetical protein R2764_19930 [Bacteroidales bacterium]